MTNQYKVISRKSIKLGANSTRTTVSLKNIKENTPLEADDLDTIIEKVNDQTAKSEKYNYKYVVTVQNALNNHFTVKGYDDEFSNYTDDVEEYLNGRVQDTTKFSEIYSVSITIIKTRKKE